MLCGYQDAHQQAAEVVASMCARSLRELVWHSGQLGPPGTIQASEPQLVQPTSVACSLIWTGRQKGWWGHLHTTAPAQKTPAFERNWSCAGESHGTRDGAQQTMGRHHCS